MNQSHATPAELNLKDLLSRSNYSYVSIDDKFKWPDAFFEEDMPNTDDIVVGTYYSISKSIFDLHFINRNYPQSVFDYENWGSISGVKSEDKQAKIKIIKKSLLENSELKVKASGYLKSNPDMCKFNDVMDYHPKASIKLFHDVMHLVHKKYKSINSSNSTRESIIEQVAKWYVESNNIQKLTDHKIPQQDLSKSIKSHLRKPKYEYWNILNQLIDEILLQQLKDGCLFMIKLLNCVSKNIVYSDVKKKDDIKELLKSRLIMSHESFGDTYLNTSSIWNQFRKFESMNEFNHEFKPISQCIRRTLQPIKVDYGYISLYDKDGTNQFNNQLDESVKILRNDAKMPFSDFWQITDQKEDSKSKNKKELDKLEKRITYRLDEMNECQEYVLFIQGHGEDGEVVTFDKDGQKTHDLVFNLIKHFVKKNKGPTKILSIMFDVCESGVLKYQIENELMDAFDKCNIAISFSCLDNENSYGTDYACLYSGKEIDILQQHPQMLKSPIYTGSLKDLDFSQNIHFGDPSTSMPSLLDANGDIREDVKTSFEPKNQLIMEDSKYVFYSSVELRLRKNAKDTKMPVRNKVKYVNRIDNSIDIETHTIGEDSEDDMRYCRQIFKLKEECKTLIQEQQSKVDDYEKKIIECLKHDKM
eukprot:NODE_70_length_24940_cov_0.663138.p2 type:complete len:644 gc:universal NODE_70_length_24940_cov_0.663138:17638-15707(-)